MRTDNLVVYRAVNVLLLVINLAASPRFPQATTVSFMNDGLKIHFGTSTDSQKSQNLELDDKVSLKIDLRYETWTDIVGLSIGGTAVRVAEGPEFENVVRLMFKKFPQIPEYAMMENVELAIFRIDPVVISLLDYREGFGHCDLVKI